MSKKTNPIAVFDSGVGGLSVYSKFREALPSENTIYFGDLKNLPYGNKSKEELIVFAKNILDFFKSKKVKAVVIACNTSSALAYDSIKDDYDFEIYRIGDAKKSEYDSIRTRIDFDLFRDYVYTELRPAIEESIKLHLIKLKWLYNGNVIYSIAIATDEKGIFFDTIGHFIVVNRKTTITEGNCNSYTANDRLTK